MNNFKKDIEYSVEVSTIECVVILSSSRNWENEEPNISEEFVDVPLSWEVASKLLDYEYDAGFGSQDCHSINIYTPTEVWYIHEYDGSTNLEAVPRNPPAI